MGIHERLRKGERMAIKYPPLPVTFNVEKEVAFYYSSVISQILNCSFKARFNTDGLFESSEIKLLAEYKCGVSLTKKGLIQCVVQNLFYIKRIEKAGELLPNVIFIGNEENYCIFDSSNLNEYLKLDVNWFEISPSQAFIKPPEVLYNAIEKSFTVHLYSLSNIPILEQIINNFRNNNIGLKMTVNNDNVGMLFEEFITSNIVAQKLEPHEVVALFASILFGECSDIVKDENKITTPLSNKQIVKIYRKNYDSFLKIVKEVGDIKIKDEIMAQSDRLIEEVYRRFHGEFYTPKIWVNEAHKMICETIDPHWYENYVVWDTCCGLANLTRDYTFTELYMSTLHQEDIDIIKQRGYNPEAKAIFQYDFLNDDVLADENVLPMVPNNYISKLEQLAPGLIEAFQENKKILIIMNPPYGAAGGSKILSIRKENISNTKIKNIMKNQKLAHASLQLFCQFLFRIIGFKKYYNETNISIASFSTPIFLAGPSFKNFRKLYLNEFSYIRSIFFRSDEFDSVSGIWGILFSLWNSGKTIIQDSFVTTMVDKDTTLNKVLYNTDNVEPATSHLKRTVPEKSWIEYPNFSSGLVVKETHNLFLKNSIGTFVTASNDVNQSIFVTGVLSGASSIGGIPITKNNFLDFVSLFTAKTRAPRHWSTMHDQFLVPNKQIDGYQQWNYDAIVYTIFKEAQVSTSVRNIFYKNKQWNIKNEFFWLPNQFMQDLANQNNFEELYRDANTFNQERFVYQELQKVNLSPDAKEVLDKTIELVIKIFPYRKKWHDLHPDWHLQTWDAGWYQTKLILKNEPDLKKDFDDFKELYKKFEDRMREGVYKFGFLK